MQEARAHAGGVELELGDDGGDVRRMDEVWVTALAHLPVVSLLGEAKSSLDQGGIRIRVVRTETTD